jgi:hypothetical protein
LIKCVEGCRIGDPDFNIEHAVQSHEISLG